MPIAGGGRRREFGLAYAADRHRRDQDDYGQHAIIGNLLPEQPLDNCARTNDSPTRVRSRYCRLRTIEPRSSGRSIEHDAGRILELDDDKFLARTADRVSDTAGNVLARRRAGGIPARIEQGDTPYR